MSLRPLFQQLVDATIVLYSLLVIASSAPSLHTLSSLLLVPYYVLIPGYTMTSAFLGETRLIGMAFNSVVWSVALIVAVYSLQTIDSTSRVLPISLVVPALTLLFFTYGVFHRRVSF